MKAGTVELEIERVVAGGFGLARTADGAVLVRGALPGERVTARPRAVGGVLRAHVIEIIAPHPSRVGAADLPPGADLPLDYEAQLPIKHGLVTEALTRIAKLDAPVEVMPVVPSPAPLGYRTAAQYVALAAGGLGARAIDSDAVVPLARDALVSPPIARAFDACAARPLHGVDEVIFRASLHEDRCLIGLIGRGGQPVVRAARALAAAPGVAGVTWGEPSARGRFRGQTTLLEGRADLLEDFGGILASVTVASFAQVNPPAAGALFLAAAAAAAARSDSATTGAGGRALELYAGSGILGMHLARSFDQVVAVEISADAVRRGQADARRLGVANISFERVDARAAKHLFPADVVIVDPPRAGLGGAVVDLLAAHLPRRVVYVSCDPSTWARDVARLGAAGYRPTMVQPYDLYPFTHHVEILSVLER